MTDDLTVTDITILRSLRVACRQGPVKGWANTWHVANVYGDGMSVETRWMSRALRRLRDARLVEGIDYGCHLWRLTTKGKYAIR